MSYDNYLQVYRINQLGLPKTHYPAERTDSPVARGWESKRDRRKVIQFGATDLKICYWLITICEVPVRFNVAFFQKGIANGN